MAGGELFEQIQKTKITERDAATIMRQIGTAVQVKSYVVTSAAANDFGIKDFSMEEFQMIIPRNPKFSRRLIIKSKTPAI